MIKYKIHTTFLYLTSIVLIIMFPLWYHYIVISAFILLLAIYFFVISKRYLYKYLLIIIFLGITYWSFYYIPSLPKRYLLGIINIFILLRFNNYLLIHKKIKHNFSINLYSYLLLLFYLIIFNIYTVSDINSILLIILFFAVTFIIIFSLYFILLKKKLFKSLSFSLILTIILIEFFWTLLFFPTSIMVNATVLLLIFFILFELLYIYDEDKQMNTKKWLYTLFIAIIGIIIIFYSASWF